MAVHFKFKSSTAVMSVPVPEPFISLRTFKDRITCLNLYGRGRDGGLAVYDSSTGLEIDDDTPIARNSLVLIQRIPRVTGSTIVVEDLCKPDHINVEQQVTTARSVTTVDEKSAAKLHAEVDFSDFGDILDAPTGERASLNPPVSTKPDASGDEDAKIKALIETSSLDWQSPISNAYPYTKWRKRFYHAPHYGAKSYKNLTRLPGYVCQRCKVPGHFIKFCPTNGDRAFDIKKPPSLPTAPPTVFEKDMGWRQTSAVNIADLPPELNCAICKNMIRDAVLASKCCFSSFCDACIRGHIISKSMCFCGSKNGSADDLIPNLTLRETISNMLASRSCITSDVSGSRDKQEHLDAIHGKQDQGEKKNKSGDNASSSTKAESAVVMYCSEVKQTADDAQDCISKKQACTAVKDCSQTAIPEVVDEIQSKPKEDVYSPSILVMEPKEMVAPVDHGIKSKRQKIFVQEGISVGSFATPNPYAMHGDIAQFYPWQYNASYGMVGMPMSYEAYMAGIGGYPTFGNTPYYFPNFYGCPTNYSEATFPKHQPRRVVAAQHRPNEVQKTFKHASTKTERDGSHDRKSECGLLRDTGHSRNSGHRDGMRSHDRSPNRHEHQNERNVSDHGGRKRTRSSASRQEYNDDRYSEERNACSISGHRDAMRSHDRSPNRLVHQNERNISDHGGRKRTRSSSSRHEYNDDRYSDEPNACSISGLRAGDERDGRSHSRHEILHASRNSYEQHILSAKDCSETRTVQKQHRSDLESRNRKQMGNTGSESENGECRFKRRRR